MFPIPGVIEHKHFEFGQQEKTVISREYSSEWSVGMEPYYPVNDEKNNRLFEEYKKLAEKEGNVIFGGRLGDYKYYDMDKVIAAALARLESIDCPQDRDAPLHALMRRSGAFLLRFQKNSCMILTLRHI